MSTLQSQGSFGMCLLKQSLTLALPHYSTPALLREGVKFQKCSLTLQSSLGNPRNSEPVP